MRLMYEDDDDKPGRHPALAVIKWVAVTIAVLAVLTAVADALITDLASLLHRP